jgi:hypothetical protein
VEEFNRVKKNASFSSVVLKSCSIFALLFGDEKSFLKLFLLGVVQDEISFTFAPAKIEREFFTILKRRR